MICSDVRNIFRSDWRSVAWDGRFGHIKPRHPNAHNCTSYVSSFEWTVVTISYYFCRYMYVFICTSIITYHFVSCINLDYSMSPNLQSCGKLDSTVARCRFLHRCATTTQHHWKLRCWCSWIGWISGHGHTRHSCLGPLSIKWVPENAGWVWPCDLTIWYIIMALGRERV